jgi:hypothetical protein
MDKLVWCCDISDLFTYDQALAVIKEKNEKLQPGEEEWRLPTSREVHIIIRQKGEKKVTLTHQIYWCLSSVRDEHEATAIHNGTGHRETFSRQRKFNICLVR